MTESELRTKYGDESVLCIKLDDLHFNPKDGPFFSESKMQFCYADAESLPRWLVENNPDYKQLVNYALLRRFSADGFFVTKRIGGDDRLIGQRSICIGGHVQGGETLSAAMLRELNEETGVTDEGVTVARRVGYIYDGSSDVSSCHFGIVWDVVLNDQCNVAVQESDRMTAEWMDIESIAALSESGKLESWSDIIYKKLLKRWR